jgi:uncharacterized membrane protein
MADDYVNARLVTLTDGVLSIAMTLLVLDIRLPVSTEKLSDGDVWRALVAIWPQFFSYGLSFLVTAAMWLSHVRKFRRLARTSAPLIWLNIAFLLGVGLVPFTTSLLAENSGAAATQVYAAVMAFSSLMLGLMSLHVVRRGLVQPDTPGEGRRGTVWQFGTATVFALSILVAFWSADAAKYSWLILIPLGFLRRATSD